MQEIISDIQDDNCIKPYSYDEFMVILLNLPPAPLSTYVAKFDIDWYHRCMNIISGIRQPYSDPKETQKEDTQLLDFDNLLHKITKNPKERKLHKCDNLYIMDILSLYPHIMCEFIKKGDLKFNCHNFDRFYLSLYEYKNKIKEISRENLYLTVKVLLNSTYGMLKYYRKSKLKTNFDVRDHIYSYINNNILKIIDNQANLLYYDVDVAVFISDNNFMITQHLDYLGINYEIKKIETFEYKRFKRFEVNGTSHYKSLFKK